MTVRTWPRVHIASAPEPLREGTTIEAKCGLFIPNAVWVFTWNTDSGGLITVNPDFINCCRVCQKHRADGRYVYGLVAGQDSQTLTQESA